VNRKFKRIRWWLEYGLLYSLFFVSRLMPERMLLAMGRGLGRLVYHVLQIRRGVVLENLRASLGPDISDARVHELARRFYVNLGMTLMEFFRLHDLSREDILERVHIEGLEHLQACRRRGQSALLTSGHFGNWELLGAVIAAHGYPIRYLIKSQSNPYVDRMQNEIRRRAGIGVIRQGPSVRQLVYTLRRREFVGILADQDGGNQGVFVDFLGREASVFRGPAVFAFRTHSPIIPVAIIREKAARHRVLITPPLEIDESWDEETAVLRLTQSYTDRLASVIRRYPDQYFWVHRRWKTKKKTL
jgi:KDO2-lipid IV(A) lauroyltransferase